MGSSRRPAPRASGDIRYRVVRGPKDENLWYWRAERYTGGTETVWTGWATVEEADRAVATLVSTGNAPVTGMTVRDLLSFWFGSVEDRRDIKPHTVSGYKQGAIRVRNVIGTVALPSVDRATLERLVSVGLSAGRKISGIRSDLRILSIAWKWGQEVNLFPPRALPRLRFHMANVQRPVPTQEDVLDVLGRVRPEVRMAIVLMLATGARRAEVCGLRRRDVHADGQMYWLQVEGKGSLPRRIPVTGEAAEALRCWLLEHPGEAGEGIYGYTPTTMFQYIHRDLHAAGRTWQPHAIRRLTVDRVYRAGVDPGTAGRLLGHTPEVALRHYRQAAQQDVEGAVRVADLGNLGRSGGDPHKNPHKT